MRWTAPYCHLERSLGAWASRRPCSTTVVRKSFQFAVPCGVSARRVCEKIFERGVALLPKIEMRDGDGVRVGAAVMRDDLRGEQCGPELVMGRGDDGGSGEPAMISPRHVRRRSAAWRRRVESLPRAVFEE